jgi:probable rRNA maturation factor
MVITFQNQDIAFTLKDKLKIKAWIKRVIEAEKKTLGQLNFVFTSDKNLLATNIQFLNHNTYTDIITFDYCEAQKINGDIIISVERVRENAKTFKVVFEDELKRVIIHGVLHLCGYKDKSKKDVEQMRSKENLALRKF